MKFPECAVRPAQPADGAALAEIYNFYVAQTPVTFELESVSASEMARRVSAVSRAFPWLIAEAAGSVRAYAYLAPWREREAYRRTAETSVYVRRGDEGAGMGSLLMERLIAEAAARGLHALVSCVTLPNARSAALHEKFAFREVGRFAEVGFKFNQWLDVGFWELVLDSDAHKAHKE